MADAEEQDSDWTLELETVLIDGCDYGTLRNICKGRPVPQHLREEVWQICLGITGKGNQLASFDELFDMPEQDILREDCQALVEKLGNEDEEKLSVASDLESILTCYCKSRDLSYSRGNGWLEILQPMLALKMNKADLYNCFYALISKFITRDCVKNGKPFHLLRLLLLYHDPELCSFLDSKRIYPDAYALGWFQSLFSAPCDLNVILNMWDVYLQHGDPFLLFFLALVILVNAKTDILRDQIVTMADCSKQDIIDKLSTFPSALEAEDIEDFCGLAQYYASKTPQSFRKEFQNPLFGTSLASQKQDLDSGVAQALCLPVSVTELLQSSRPGMTDGVKYFVVDCRPAEQYNSGHLHIAFHLDANLMLQNPTEFSSAVSSLMTAQKQAIAAGAAAGGEHLCFMGSGREEEDQYVNMVVAHFLQKHSQYVSMTLGGYAELHAALVDDLSGGLSDHNPRSCIVCNPEAAALNGLETQEFHSPDAMDQLRDTFGRLLPVVKEKSAVMKEKMINYIKNETGVGEKHVSSTDRVGKRYRNVASVFTIGDDEEEEVTQVPSSDDERRDVVNIDTWLNKPDVKHAYQCQQVKDTGYTYPSHLLVTESHLYVLREIPNKKGMSWIQARRALGSIVKITSKKRHPELITFKYGSNEEQAGIQVTDIDRFLIPKAAEATKVIKQQIMKVLDTLSA